MRNDIGSWAWVIGTIVAGAIVAALIGMNPGVGIAIGAGIGVAVVSMRTTQQDTPKDPGEGIDRPSRP